MKVMTVAIMVAVMAGQASAETYNVRGNWRILAPTDVHLDTYKNQHVHDPYLAPADQNLGYGANFNLDFDILKYKGLGLYWKNLLHFDQSLSSGQVKHAGWQYEIGATVYQVRGVPKIELFKQHHSRHILEEPREEHFPVYDRYGIRFRIYP